MKNLFKNIAQLMQMIAHSLENIFSTTLKKRNAALPPGNGLALQFIPIPIH